MKTVKTILMIATIHLCMITNAQNFGNYNFSNYPAAVTNGKKATLILASNKLGKTFKTRISQDYKTSKVNFAGHYIVIDIFKRGGAMVDVNNGKIYDFPDGSDVGMGCDDSFEYPEATHKNSKMVVFSACSQNMQDEKYNDIVYSIYIWDEANKRFSNVKEIKKTVKNNN
jgi:hypothetical protein